MNSLTLGHESRPGSGHRIVLSIPTGFQLRQFIHSGVLGLLVQRGFRVVIASPNREGEGFAARLAEKNVEIRWLPLEREGPLSWRYWLIRQHLLANGRPTESQKRVLADLQRQHRGLALLARCGNRLLRLAPWVRKRALRWERLILRNRAAEAFLARERVDLVLLGSPGFMRQDAILLAAAARRGIPVVAAITSWDNLSSKGLINPQPDHLLVWSDHMRGEAIHLQGMPADRIVETGPPLYDLFTNAGRFGTRSENLRRLGLDPDRKLIVYGTNHAGYFPDEVEVVKHVARWVEEDALGMPCQLWVRLHPQAVTGPYQVPLEPYRRLSSDRVRIECPPIRDGNMPWDLPEHDLEHLIALLRDADVVINTASTLAIDAAALDRPAVCVAYDPSGAQPYERSVRRYYDFTHMAFVVQAGAVQLAGSPEALRGRIVDYLKNPALDREGRQRIVQQQFGRIDGKSAARVVDQVVKIVSP